MAGELAALEDKNQTVSQLDCLPPRWLHNSKDIVGVFSRVVSPAISEQFESELRAVMKGAKFDDLKAGPGGSFYAPTFLKTF